MKLLNILFLLSTIMVLASGKLLVFNSTQAVNCIKMNPCFFDDPDNWGGETIDLGDSFKIDVSQLVYGVDLNNSFVYFKTRVKLQTGAYGDFTSIGSAFIQPYIWFANTTQLSFNQVQVSNSTVDFDNDGESQQGNNFEVMTSWYVYNSTIKGSDTNLVSEGIILDGDSSMTFSAKSAVTINGMATFYGSLSLSDESSFSSVDVIDGYLTFHQGINSDGLVQLGKATVYGNSNFENLIVNGEVSFNDGATATIMNILRFTPSSGSTAGFILNQGSQVTIAGNDDQSSISSLAINGNSTFIVSNFNFDIANVIGDGGVILYSNAIFNETNFSNNEITNIQSNAVDIHLTGKVELFVSNCNGGSIIEVLPTEGDNPAKILTFDQTNSFASISTSNTEIAVNDNAALTLWGTGNGIYNGNLNVLGYLFLNQISITIGQGKFITIADVNGKVYLNGSTVYGSVDVMAGSIVPEGNAFIKQSLNIEEGGAIEFNAQTNSLQVSQNCLLDGTFYMDSYITPGMNPQLIVDGNVQFNQNTSTLFISFDNIPARGQVYDLIQFGGKTSGTLNKITLLLDGNLFTSISSSVQNLESNKISLVLEPSIKVHKKLPGWAAFLIVVVVCGSVAGGFYGFYRYKKREGYLPLN